ncbi:MAG TPA: DUF4349 domain-containing protein [Candidatus Hydrogenedentes bacterium]|nr:DUF4349 domain-containing protein [Candidatus Hydrogenedentota bacterium]
MRDYTPRYLVGALCLASVFVACSMPRMMGSKEFSPAADRAAGRPLHRTETIGEALSSQGSTALAAIEATQPDRHLIKDARITLEVVSAKEASAQIITKARETGGYAADVREVTDALGGISITLQVRVPADRFEETMQYLDGLGRVQERHVSSEDVTEEFVDTQARVRNFKRTEERLLEHLERTAKLEDILSVERELARVRGEVERLEGRLRFLSHRVAFSTITASLREKAKARPVVPPESFSTLGVATSAVRSLVTFARAIWIVVIWLGVWAVVWIPLVYVAYRLVRSEGRRAGGNKTPRSATETDVSPPS